MYLILMTTVFYKAVIFQGEIWCLSLLGLKGLKSNLVLVVVYVLEPKDLF